MQSAVIRKLFIEFFAQKGHKHVAAAPVVNKEDATLMFTNAGMNQFKDFFLGHQVAPYPRVISIQPCLRVSGKHNDLEEVGTDTYHHTMFEMMGNWSFGDYFKQQAIQWAWELLTKVYRLPEERLYVTIFGGDSQDKLGPDKESRTIWEQYIAAERILSCAKQDNFWEMGNTGGPCGPCTEIHVDIRPEAARQQVPGHSLVNKEHPQVIELWNLVFIQYNRLATGHLKELPTKHVDTGLGLERLAMVLQAKDSSYDTDLFALHIKTVTTLVGQVYGRNSAIDTAIRVIVDHLRAATFAIADGQLPSNVKAGYVIRRLLRRAVRYGYTYLGFEAPFIYRLVEGLAIQLQTVYPQLLQQKVYLDKVVQEEEEAFFKTLAAGLQKLDQLSQVLRGRSSVIDGAIAFELYDTYGFPLDLTMLLAKERGLTVDEVGFSQALHTQRQRSKQAAVVEPGDWIMVAEGNTALSFIGYDQLKATAQIVKYRTVKMQDKQVHQVVLDQTPFYPEGGGQVGDTGWLVAAGEMMAVLNTQKENELIIHHLNQLPKKIEAPLQAIVDQERRTLIANNHTATHLLHAVLKQVLGTHVAQRGSLVNDQLLRFDFLHSSNLSPQELAQIESIVNQKIRDNIALKEQRYLSLSAAKAIGAVALFGERYGEQVRVITFNPDFSVELCGGTHVPFTGHLGFFKITASTAVAAGVRRIVAATAVAAERWVYNQLTLLGSLQTLLKHPQDPQKALQQLLQEKVLLSKQLVIHEAEQVRIITDQLRSKLNKICGIYTLVAQAVVPQVATLKQIALALQEVGEPHFVVLATVVARKPHIAVALSEDLARRWSQNAQDIAKKLAEYIQGGGGGSPTLAIGGGKDVDSLPQVLQMAEKILERNMTK